MEFRILGPLEVARDGQVLPALANKPRALLALLVLHRGAAISLDDLVDALWAERPPATATKSVQVYVSQLRRLLGEGVVETRGRGYALTADPADVDAVRFERMLGEGSERLAEGRAREASALLSEALGLWRGPALADFTYESWAQTEIGRLEDLRLAALEERIDADLALGRHGTLVGELEELVERHPHRDRLSGQLMLALYRSGRQTEALEAYRRLRDRAVEELGIEPGPALRELQAAILRQDSDLQAPVPFAARLRRRRRRGGLLIAAGGAVLVLAGVGAALIANGRDADTPVGRSLEALPASSCSPVVYAAGRRPRHLIASDQVMQGDLGVLGTQVAATVEAVLRANRFMAGRIPVAYQACDSEAAGCAATARMYTGNPDVVGVIGPLLSHCAHELIPITNRARPGPLAVLSPSTTSVWLTRRVAGGEDPEAYYPTGVRNFVRVAAADDFQFAAHAMLARRLGARRAFVLVGSEESAEHGRAFARAAERLGLDVVGSADSYVTTRLRALAERIATHRVDAVLLTGGQDGREVIHALRTVLGDDVLLMTSDWASVPEFVSGLGPAGEGLRVSIPGIDPRALRGEGRRLIARVRASVGEPHPYVVAAAQATQMLLDAIARSDGTRPSVVDELFAGEVRGGLLGNFSVTPSGDLTANRVTIFRVQDGEMRIDRTLTPPLSLVAGS